MLNIKRFICNPIQENTYIIYDESKEAVIVDCGAFYPEEKQAIKEYIDQEGLTVRHLLLTHDHFDHTFGNVFIQENYGLEPEGYGKKEISFGTHRFEVIPTPGHNPDAVVFYCKEEKLALTGDTLFKGSIGRTDMEGGSYDDILKSLQYLKEILPDDTQLLPGHGDHTFMDDEKRTNPYL
ncbi:MAG: MBL fold metallo-hydrolase [Prevotella sp.]|nr:MBL fold metallo-hydrolase [Candidatus Equicola stercoris]